MRTANDNAMAPDGWEIDGDGWFVRAFRSGDRMIATAHCHFGFVCEGTVFVREPQHCYDYDRGVITPYPRSSR